MLRSVSLAFAITILLASCTKDKTGNCENATLYYMPNCATIKGYVVFDNTLITRTFKHDIDPQFRGTGLKVCIRYENVAGSLFTTDCMTEPSITITSISAR